MGIHRTGRRRGDGPGPEVRTRRLVMADAQVEVRAVCPSCGSAQYVQYGGEGRVVYRRCRSCGHRGKVYRVTSVEVVAVEMAE